MAKKKNVEAKETKMKKSFKETFKEKTAKVKAIWDDYKVAIVAGAIGVASSAALVYLVTEGDGNVTEVPVPTLPEPEEEPKALPEPKSCRSDFYDEELKELVWNERGGDELETKLNDKLQEIDDLCNEHDMAVGVFTVFGEKDGSYDDGCIEYFADGSKIKDNM